MLRRFLLARGEWTDCVKKAVTLYKNLTHNVLKMSPNYAIFGFDLRSFGVPPLSPPPALLNKQLPQPALTSVAVADLAVHLDRHSPVAVVTALRQTQAEHYHNRLVKPMSFSVGDFVFVFDSNQATTFKQKLSPPWVGPRRILQMGASEGL